MRRLFGERGTGPSTRLPVPRLLLFGAAGGVAAFMVAWLCFLGLNAAFPFPESALHPAPARLVLDREGEPLRAFLAPDGQWRFPVELEEVSTVMRKTLLRSEDRWLRWHPGVNPFAILRAAWDNLLSGRVVSGGSTLAMQVSRLAEPRPRTLRSKLVEAFRAVQLRWNHSPDEILEFWLNMAPFGGNIVGVGAASRFYFNKTPDRLSLGEAALLTALPRSPNGYDPIRNPAAAHMVRSRVLDRLHGLFPDKRLAQVAQEPLPTALTPQPMRAPHFALEALSRLSGPRLRTSLDPRAQRLAEETVRARINELRIQGIDSAAVVVLDTATREIRALVGSPSFFDDERSGQIDGALIRRSPGSTLKPFLYAQAMDLGLVFPDALLLDIPTDYAGYAPENYDGTFRGSVTAEYALAHSLNVPAVRLLGSVGLERFLDLLRRGGLNSLDKPAGHYGLPLILGGGEVTLLDLVNLYATLAQGGRPAPVRFAPAISTDPAQARPTRDKPLLSPEACFLTTRILSQVERPDMPRAWALTATAPEAAWKTGTSFGHRDAWAIGFSGRFTIGVWVGNLDGRAAKGISGARHAGPLLFDLFHLLEDNASTLPEFGPLDLDQVELCAQSRKLPGPYCTDRITATIIPGRTKLEQDDWTVRIFVDDATGERLAGDCLAARPHHAETFVRLPPGLAAWRESVGLPVTSLPRLHPDCQALPDGGLLRIVSPDPATPYRIRPGTPPEYQQIPLVADASPETRELFWFLDGKLLSAARPGVPFFLPAPPPGEHKIAVQDDQGRSDALVFSVER
ncbi:penicillin-binding protein 1C [Paucidesulfovibrio longus]|uniref:penicillin-binding protein 1C n=1 Tax=Paucidesulfovibrio longus TaxID=889 RepID=UPI0003B2FF56|nr:penicillin-binding protein 1C [Paucidesulfovibrio longus]